MLLVYSIFFRILAAVKSARVKGSVEQYPLETDPSSAYVIPDMLENIVKLVNSNFFQINLKFSDRCYFSWWLLLKLKIN